MTTRIVCWNINKWKEPWRQLSQMDADIALLQEAGLVPSDVAGEVDTGPAEHWDSHVWNSCWYKEKWKKLYDRWTMVVRLSDRVKVEWFRQVSPIGGYGMSRDEMAVSGIGTIAAARILPKNSEPFFAVSMYARWKSPHPLVKTKWKVGYPDGSAHSIISDMSAFIGDTDPSTHRIVAAGDLNMVHGTLDEHSEGFSVRERTVWDRLDALGFEFVGPQCPNGRKAEPTPNYLPEDTKNVPTYRPPGKTPEEAIHQLDYVFASRGFHEEVRVRALNSVEDWGASDHCRLLIEVDA